MSNKFNENKFITPQGKCKFAKVFTPEISQHYQNGLFSMDVYFDEVSIKAVIAQVQKLYKDYMQTIVSDMSEDEKKVLRENFKPFYTSTGGIVKMRFTRKAEKGAPAVFDAQLKPVTRAGGWINNDSDIIVKVYASPYFISKSGISGVTLVMDAVQIVREAPSTFKPKSSPTDFGFKAVSSGSIQINELPQEVSNTNSDCPFDF